ncbi:C-type lectin domain family 4 member C-like isoform X1 [Paramisgurnus dabryanus]|uniref:C-type lectin domain family 4 member C-like isoform X1 n=1 Tax=Paramisgurnus dabryanus TaxID=90735 RepID=UPI0031F4480D
MPENIYCNTISRTKTRSTSNYEHKQQFSDKRPDGCVVVLLVLLFLSLVANAVLAYLYFRNGIVGCEPVTNCSEPGTVDSHNSAHRDNIHDELNMWIHPEGIEDWTTANYCPEKNFIETWVKDRDKFYVLSNDIMNWNSSRERCQALGGDLVIISSKEEQSFFADRIGASQVLYWIGLTDSHMEGKWMWVDNTSLNENPGSFWTAPPDNFISAEYPDGEDCVVLNGRTKDALWGDVSCFREERRICELLCS